MIRLAAAFALLVAQSAAAAENVDDCNPSKRLYVLGSIVGAGQGLCYAFDPDGGASLSFQRDHQAGTSTGEVAATLAWRAFEPIARKNTAYTAFLFARAQGFFDVADGPNEVRLGVYGEAMTHYANPERHSHLFMTYGLSLFYLTDFDGEASGYGVTATVLPVLNSDRFGVNYIGVQGSPFLIARADLDALWVDRGGNTGYADGSENAFLSGRIGIGYGKPGKFDVSLIHTQGTDLLNGGSYGATQARLSLPLGGSDKASLALVYQRSEDRVSKQVSESTNVALNFRF